MVDEPVGLDQKPAHRVSYQWEAEDPDYLLGVLEDWASALRSPPLTLEELLEKLSNAAPNFSATVLAFSQEKASR
jgi:hypothetical protein